MAIFNPILNVKAIKANRRRNALRRRHCSHSEPPIVNCVQVGCHIQKLNQSIQYQKTKTKNTFNNMQNFLIIVYNYW